VHGFRQADDPCAQVTTWSRFVSGIFGLRAFSSAAMAVAISAKRASRGLHQNGTPCRSRVLCASRGALSECATRRRCVEPETPSGNRDALRADRNRHCDDENTRAKSKMPETKTALQVVDCATDRLACRKPCRALCIDLPKTTSTFGDSKQPTDFYSLLRKLSEALFVEEQVRKRNYPQRGTCFPKRRFFE